MGETIATNKKAFRDYFIEKRWECGIALKGGEVKSIRAGHVNFKGSFARVEENQVFLYGLTVDAYKQASYMNEEPDRARRLLLHKAEIKKLFNEATLKRLAIVPTKMYFNNRGLVKVEIAIGKGKKMTDKRDTIKKREQDVQMGRELRNRGVR